jgi:hypothetical protein
VLQGVASWIPQHHKYRCQKSIDLHQGDQFYKKALLANHSEEQVNLLHEACKFKNLAAVKMLVQHYLNINRFDKAYRLILSSTWMTASKINNYLLKIFEKSSQDVSKALLDEIESGVGQIKIMLTQINKPNVSVDIIELKSLLVEKYKDLVDEVTFLRNERMIFCNQYKGDFSQLANDADYISFIQECTDRLKTVGSFIKTMMININGCLSQQSIGIVNTASALQAKSSMWQKSTDNTPKKLSLDINSNESNDLFVAKLFLLN